MRPTQTPKSNFFLARSAVRLSENDGAIYSSCLRRLKMLYKCSRSSNFGTGFKSISCSPLAKHVLHGLPRMGRYITKYVYF